MGIFSNKTFFSTLSGLENNLNSVDLKFLFRKSGEISSLKFVLAAKVVDIIKHFWDIDMNGKAITPKKIESLTELISQNIVSENIKLGKFRVYIDGDKLYIKNGDLIIAEISEDSISFFIEMAVQDVSSPGLKADNLIIDESVSIDNMYTVIEKPLVFRKNFQNELITKKDFYGRDQFLREYLLQFEQTSKKVESIINSDRTPSFNFDGINLGGSTNINLNTSSIILIKDNLPKLYLSEVKELDSNYFSDPAIYNTFDDGYINIGFSEEFTCFYVNSEYYVVQFLSDLDRNLKINIKNNHGKIDIDESISVYKFDKDYQFIEELTGSFNYGSLMLINATKNYLKSKIDISYQISNVFNENYSGKHEIIVNEGINFELEPVVSYSGNNVTDSDQVNFYQREFSDFSGEIGFGYYTEEEMSKNRKFINFDFTNGMIEEDTGSRISISDVNFSLYIPARIDFSGFKENIFKVGDTVYNLSQDLDLEINLVINKGMVTEIKFDDKSEALGNPGDQDSWNQSVETLLIHAGMIDSSRSLTNIFFNNLQLHKKLVDKTIEIDFEVVTEVKNFRFVDSLTLVPRNISDGDILMNNSLGGDYVFTINKSGLHYSGEVMSEKVKFSYTNFSELINNVEVEKVTYEIYDNLNFNPVTGENKGTQTPTRIVFNKVDGIFYPANEYGEFVDVNSLSVFTQFSSENINSYINVKMIIDRKFENKQVILDKRYKISDLDLSLTYTLNSIEQDPMENQAIRADIGGIELNNNIHNIYLRAVCQDFRGIGSLRLDYDFTDSNYFIVNNFPKKFEKFYTQMEFKPVNKMIISQSVNTSVEKTLKIRWNTLEKYDSVVLASNFDNRKWSISHENTMAKKTSGYELYWTVSPGEDLLDREFKFLVNGREFICPNKGDLEITFNGVSVQFEISNTLDNLFCWNITEDNIPENIGVVSLYNIEEYVFNDKVILIDMEYHLEKALGNTVGIKLRSENKVNLSQFLYSSKIEYLSSAEGVFTLIDTKNSAKSFSYSNSLASPNFMVLSRGSKGSSLIEDFSNQPKVRFYLDRPEIFSELRIFRLNIGDSGVVNLGEELQTAFNPSDSFYYILSRDEESNLDFLNNKSYAIIAYNQDSNDYTDIKCNVKMFYEDTEMHDLGTFTIFNYSIKNQFERTFISEFTGFVVDDEIKFRLGLRMGSKMLSGVNVIGDISFNNKNMMSNIAFDKFTLLTGGSGDNIKYTENLIPGTTFNFLIEETLEPGTPPEKKEIDLIDPEIYNVKYINETSFITEDISYLDLRCYDNTGDYKFKVRQIDEKLPDLSHLSATEYQFPRLKDSGEFFAVREGDVGEEFYSALLSKYYLSSGGFENFYDMYAFEDKKGLNFTSQMEKDYYYTGQEQSVYFGDITFKPVHMDSGLPTDLQAFRVDLTEDFEIPISMKVEFENSIYMNNIKKYSQDTRLKASIKIEPRSSKAIQPHEVSLNGLYDVPNHPNIAYELCDLKSVFAYLSGTIEVFSGMQDLNISLNLISEDVEVNLLSTDTYISFPKIRGDISKSIIGETNAIIKLKEALKGENQGSINGEVIEYLDVFVDLINEGREIMGTVHEDQLELTGLNPVTPYRIRVYHKILDDVHVVSEDMSFTTEIPSVYVRELVEKKYGTIEFMAEGADNFLSRCYSFDILKPTDIKAESPVDEGDFYDTESPVVADVSTEEQNKRLIIRVMANKNSKSSSNVPVLPDGTLDFGGAPFFYTQPKNMPEVVRSVLESSGDAMQLHFTELDFPTDVKIKCMVIDEEGIISYVII